MIVAIRLTQINAVARVAQKVRAWHQVGFPSSNLARLRSSFSAWLSSPSSGSPFGQNHEGRSAPRPPLAVR